MVSTSGDMYATVPSGPRGMLGAGHNHNARPLHMSATNTHRDTTPSTRTQTLGITVAVLAVAEARCARLHGALADLAQTKVADQNVSHRAFASQQQIL